jgi:HSP20 family molecular chaperone IbpA
MVLYLVQNIVPNILLYPLEIKLNVTKMNDGYLERYKYVNVVETEQEYVIVVEVAMLDS